jgi:hypothetical protein
MSEKLKRRIVIVGAGPAGLSAALYLKRKGYVQVTVLEKLGRVGGLCRTITQDYRSFDLGANYITPAFREVLKLARQFRAKMYGEKDGAAVEMRDDNSKSVIWRDIWTAVKNDLSTWRFVVLCAKYTWLRFKLNSIINRPGFGRIHEHPALCVSFYEWLKHHGLDDLQTVFEAPITIMGYGYIRSPDENDPLRTDREIPAPYALKYMSVLTFVTLGLKVSPLFRWLPWPKRFVLGYERLWESVAATLNVQRNIQISKIKRGKTIQVTFKQLQQVDNEVRESPARTQKFDILIVACPLQAAVVESFLQDVTEEEKELLGHVVTYSYKMTSCHVKDFDLRAPVVASLPLPPINQPWAITRQYEESTLVQFYSRLPADICYPERLRAKVQETVDRAHANSGADSKSKSVEVLPMNDISKPRQGSYLDEVDSEVREFVRRVGGEIDENAWRTFDQWPYFQHFRVEELKQGFCNRFDELQGKNNTYYVGGLMNFELVDTVMRYSKHIVKTYFG